MILDVKSADGVEAELIFWTDLFTDMKTSYFKMNQTEPLWYYPLTQRVALHLATRRVTFFSYMELRILHALTPFIQQVMHSHDWRN